MKRQLYIIIALLMSPLLATAITDTVRVDKACGASEAFTISIPIRLSPDDTIRYKWYCNDVLIPNAKGIATFSNRKIAYTIPANSGYSGDMAFRFAFWIDEGCEEWSPIYMVNFQIICPPTPGVISVTVGSCVSNVGAVSFSAGSCVSNVGTVSFSAGSCVSNVGTISFSE
jgi:hypothetical protein